MLGYIVMVRGMTKEDFGVFNLLYAFIPVVSTIASLGLEQTLRALPARVPPGGQPGRVRMAGSVRGVRALRHQRNPLECRCLLGWNHVAPLFKLAPYRAEFVIFCFLVLLHFQARILQLSLAGHMLQRYSVGSMAVLAIVKLARLRPAVVAGRVHAAERHHRRRCRHSPIAYRSCSGHTAPLLAGHCGGACTGRSRRTNADCCATGSSIISTTAGTLILSSKSDNFFIAAIIDPISVGIYAFYTRLSEMAQQLAAGATV